MLDSVNKLLIVVAHDDDLELMFGATLCKLRELRPDQELMVCVLCKRELNTGEPASEVLKQQKASFEVLGIRPAVCNFNFQSRFLLDHIDEVRKICSDLKKKFEPDLVLTHHKNDRHQDHRTVFEAVEIVFRGTSIMSGEIPSSSDNFKPNYYFRVDAEQLNRKYQAAQCYSKEAEKFYFKKSSIFALATFRGLSMSLDGYAEAYEIFKICVK